MSSQDFEQALRAWLRQGEGAAGGTDPGSLWRAGRRRRTRRVLLGGATGMGLVAAVAAGVLAVGGGLLPEATDTGPANPTVTVPAPTTEEDLDQEEDPGQDEQTAAPPAPEPSQDAGEGHEEPGQDQPQDWGEPLAECSTGAYTPGPMDTTGLPAEVADTVTALVRDAMRCDEQALIERAEQDGTSLSFGSTPAAEALAIPQEDPRYLSMVVLLTDTEWAVDDAGEERYYVWPAAFHADASEEDWQDVREAGLHEPALLDQMQQAGSYMGWRVGITESGEWRFLIAGD
ncbi:hypothetical protein [Ornithinicoccus halotolerans]|uniref:hypothetical protein n=1 Tax=Ornithinicoccus halotolerans TaxID=1748220 RepID=UPI001297AA8A|nr:hypothetical protein [Ornithinicoccus halotolerans]